MSDPQQPVHPSQMRQDNRLNLHALLLGRWTRLLILGLLIISGLFAVGYRILTSSSIRGVVNAPILLIQSPIDGVVRRDHAVAGATVEPGALLFEIENDRLDTSNLERIRSDHDRIAASLASAQTLAASLKEQARGLESRMAAHLQANTAHLQHKLEEIQSQEQNAQVTLQQARRDWERQRELARRGVDSAQALETARLHYDQADAEVRRLDASAASTRTELEASQSGILLDGYSGAPYTAQRLDEVRLRLNETQAQIERWEQEKTALAHQLEAEETRIQRLRSAEIRSPSLCLVQSLRVAEGTYVSKGMVLSELIDCAKSFVQATVPERLFDRIHIGQPAKVYLHGARTPVPGKITALRGAGAANEGNAEFLAAEIKATSPDSMWISVSISVDDLIRVFGSANQVGRTARVVLAPAE